MRNFIIYLFPFAFDIVVGLCFFVSRHSFAERGSGVFAVGSFVAVYGLIYIPSCLLMSKIVTPKRAKGQILIASILMIILLCALANIESYHLFLLIFAIIPFSASLFFNAFQAFMLDIEPHGQKLLSHSVGHYTFAWSMGYALGPAISYFVKQHFGWHATYYVASIIVAIIGIIAFFFKPVPSNHSDEKKENLSAINLELKSEKAMPLAAWIGLIIGLGGWVVVQTYWPLHATKLGLSDEVKAGIEFTSSATQAVSALIITLFIKWYHRPKALFLFGLFGLIGLSAFTFSSNTIIFFIGAAFYGVYLSSCFIYMVYHAMFDIKNAVKRVAINETIVGVCMLTAPLIASSLAFLTDNNFQRSYSIILIIFISGILIQFKVAKSYNTKKGFH